MILPAPDNWQTFEDLCHRLWSSMWGEGTQKNGRQGQPQNGVDIFGIPPHRTQYAGVQCKGRNENYGSKLTIAEIDAECKNALGFLPPIEKFIMATTSSRDPEIQKHCRLLTTSKKYPFNVESWSWNDISDEIQYREDIMQYFYHGIETERTNKAVYDYYFAPSKLEAFFSRDHIKASLKSEIRNTLSVLTFELFSNAFRHGHAKMGSLEISNGLLIITDDGAPFNPLSLAEGRGGYLTINNAKTIFEGMKYEYIDSHNIFTIPLTADIPDTSVYELTLTTDQLCQRGLFVTIARNIPADVEEFILNLSGRAIPPSGVYDFLDGFKFLSLKHIKVYLPHNVFFYRELKERYPEMEFITR